MFRRALKNLLESISVLSGSAASSRLLHSEEALILAYHNIIPSGQQVVGDRSLHLSQKSFATQLDNLMKTHRIVPLAELLLSVNSDNTGQSDTVSADPSEISSTDPSSMILPSFVGDRPLCAITFDDAYRGALTAGLSELKKRDLPATMFVAPGYLENQCFWWDLATPAGALGIEDSVREEYLTRDRGERDRIVTPRQKNRCETIPAYAKSVTILELEKALQYEKLSLGSHSWSHPNLASLDRETLERELRDSHSWLKDRYKERYLPVISYPYGRASETVFEVAREVGYTNGFMIEGGWTNFASKENTFTIPRLNIPAGLSKNGFIMRSSGLIKY